jgi:tetratricopeptide (TPR) repeat protein
VAHPSAGGYNRKNPPLTKEASSMPVPDWRNLVLNEGILHEPIPGDNRVVLWLPGSRDNGFRHWQRISSLPRAEVTVREGLCATPAMLIPMRQSIRGLFGRLFQHFRKASDDRAWVLPSGEPVEQLGERQTDLILVWAEDQSMLPDEAQIRTQWPESKEFHKLGNNLFLVSGIAPPEVKNESPPPQGCPQPVADQLLAAARAKGDRRKEAAALIDLGILHRQEGKPKQAAPLLEEALTIAQELGDSAATRDAKGQLGLALLALGQPQRAMQLLEQELASAREAGEPFALKAALDHTGLAYSSLRSYALAIGFFEEALKLAREVVDRKHQPELLWYLAIQHAELGQRDQAIARGQETVDMLKKAGKPQAAWFEHHLEKYRRGETSAGLGETTQPGTEMSPDGFFGASVVASVWSASSGPQERSPGLLRMAFSAGKSMAKFLGSGFRMVTPAIHQKRLQTCAGCEHHTGVRCRLCGCFTYVKARMAHEECPIGKWPT